MLVNKKVFFVISFMSTMGLFTQDLISQDDESTSRLEEVVVTAQKKEEGLSEVPISIQVFSDERIADLGITSLTSLADHVPGLHISKGAGEWNIYMRGIGSKANKGFSQSITQFIDGMPITAGQQYAAAMLDIERVEVLKGAQGVLFGKNTIGGVLNAVSKSPEIGGGFDGYWKVTRATEFDTWKFQGATNIPINDSFAMRVAYSSESSDGYTKNLYLGTDGPENQAESLRVTFLKQHENAEVSLKLTSSSNTKRSQESGISTWALAAPFPVLAGQGAAIGQATIPPYTGAVIAWNIMGNSFPDLVSGQPGMTYLDNTQGLNPTGGTIDSDSAILNITTSWNDFDIKSTTSYSEYDYVWGLDADFGPLPFLSTDSYHDFQSFTQEIVITSPQSDKFEYIAGMFYDDVNYYSINNGTFDMTVGGLFADAFPLPNVFALQTEGQFSAPDAATHTLFDQNSTSLSVFFEGTLYVNDQLTLKAGVRNSDDDKDVKGSQVMSSTGTGGLGIDTPTMAPPVLGVFNALLKRVPYNFPVQSRSDSFTTTSFKAMYDLNDNVKLYGSYAEGYKAGGFDGSENAPKVASTTPGVPSSTPGAEFQFEPEEAETIEVGAKLDFPSRSLRASIAYFTTDYKDLQTSTFDGSGFVVTNAASAEIDGVEFDFTWAPTDNLVIGGSVTSLDFAYLEFTNAGCTAPQDVAYRIATGVKDGCEQDLTGRTGDYAPEMSSSLYVNYYQTLSNDRTLKLSVSGNSVGEYYSSGDLDPNGIHDNATKIDARASITNSNGFEVSLYAKNLTDRITAHQIFDLPLVPGSYFSMWSPGREVGLILSAKF